MQYGTIKTELWAHNYGVAQEYYRYEVITRYWITNPDAYKNDAYDLEDKSTWPINNTEIAWETHAVSIDRSGKYTLVNVENTTVYRDWLEYMANEKQCEKNGASARRMMIEQHKTLVDYLWG